MVSVQSVHVYVHVAHLMHEVWVHKHKISDRAWFSGKYCINMEFWTLSHLGTKTKVIVVRNHIAQFTCMHKFRFASFRGEMLSANQTAEFFDLL